MTDGPPRLYREQDILLMHFASQLNLPPLQMWLINQYEIFLEVPTLSDTSTADNTHLLTTATPGKQSHDRQSTICGPSNLTPLAKHGAFGMTSYSTSTGIIIFCPSLAYGHMPPTNMGTGMLNIDILECSTLANNWIAGRYINHSLLLNRRGSSKAHESGTLAC
jgi:hypothetical protein